MYMNEAQKTRKRMQAIAEATTEFNAAKVGYRNEMTVTKANDLVEKANYLLRLQKTYGKSIQPNEQVQLVMDYALRRPEERPFKRRHISSYQQGLDTQEW